MMMFDKLCKKGWSSTTHRTKTVTMMGHEWSVAASSIRSDQKQQSFFVRVSSFWNEALQGRHCNRPTMPSFTSIANCQRMALYVVYKYVILHSLTRSSILLCSRFLTRRSIMSCLGKNLAGVASRYFFCGLGLRVSFSHDGCIFVLYA